MQKQYLKFSVLLIDYELLELKIEAGNGINSTSIDFYTEEKELKAFATKLTTFPKTIDDKIKYEVGEIKAGSGWYYLLLEVFCFERNGHSAIRVIVDNNEDIPYTNKTEFYITTVPASINHLGSMLNGWAPTFDDPFIWIPE